MIVIPAQILRNPYRLPPGAVLQRRRRRAVSPPIKKVAVETRQAMHQVAAVVSNYLYAASVRGAYATSLQRGMTMQTVKRPVAIIGAGPVGLSAALHLQKRGIQPIVLERGPSVGHAVRQWGHVKLFSPWRYNIDPHAVSILKNYGWSDPDLDQNPTGHELVDHYLEPLASLPEMRNIVHLDSRVVHVGRLDVDKVKTEGRESKPFQLTVSSGLGAEYSVIASSVLDVSGTWFQPNPLFSGGVFTQDELMLASKLHYGIPDVLGFDRKRYIGKRVLVVGSGHSALNTLQNLVLLQKENLGTRIVWALRRPSSSSVFGGGDEDALPERGRLGSVVKEAVEKGDIDLIAPFHARHLKEGQEGDLIISGLMGNATKVMLVDEVVVATGFRPDLEMLREVRLGIDSWLECPVSLAPLIDPNIHSCGTVRPHGARELAHPEPGFYSLGMKSYGRAPTFLLATGYEQARSVAAAIAGDWEAADRVDLSLPATGVCSSNNRSASVSCC